MFSKSFTFVFFQLSEKKRSSKSVEPRKKNASQLSTKGFKRKLLFHIPCMKYLKLPRYGGVIAFNCEKKLSAVSLLHSLLITSLLYFHNKKTLSSRPAGLSFLVQPFAQKNRSLFFLCLTFNIIYSVSGLVR